MTSRIDRLDMPGFTWSIGKPQPNPVFIETCCQYAHVLTGGVIELDHSKTFNFTFEMDDE